MKTRKGRKGKPNRNKEVRQEEDRGIEELRKGWNRIREKGERQVGYEWRAQGKNKTGDKGGGQRVRNEEEE